MTALPFYLFPAWLRPWSWKGVLLCGLILFGYGNIKYLLLDLLFLFPVQEERNGMRPHERSVRKVLRSAEAKR